MNCQLLYLNIQKLLFTTTVKEISLRITWFNCGVI